MRKILLGTLVALVLVALSGNPLAMNPLASTPLIVEAYAESTQFIGSERGDTWQKDYYQDGTDTLVKFHLGLDRYVEDNGRFKPYVQEDYKIITEHGSVKANSDGSFSFFSSGKNNNELFKDRIIAKYADISDLNTWIPLNSINNANSTLSFNGSDLVISKLKNGTGFLEYKYILHDGTWKTQLEATNLTPLNNKVFGFDQIIDLNRDSIKFGNQTKNLDNFNGTTFDKTFLIENESKILNLLNGFNFDFDLGFTELHSITVYDTGVNSSQIIFDYRTSVPLLSNQTLIIDPAYSEVTSSDRHAAEPNGSACTGTSATIVNSSVELFAYVYQLTTYNKCHRAYLEFTGLNNIPDGAIVTDVDLLVGLTSGNPTGDAIDITRMNLQGSAQSDGNTLFDGIGAGTLLLDATDAFDTGNEGDVNLDLGSTADTELQTIIDANQDWVSLGFKFDSEDPDDGKGNRGLDISPSEETGTDPTLTVTYTIPIVPLAPTNDGVTNVGTNLQYDWTFGTNFNNATQPAITNSSVYVGDTKYQYTPLANWNATQETDIGGITTSSNFEGIFHFDSIENQTPDLSTQQTETQTGTDDDSGIGWNQASGTYGGGFGQVFESGHVLIGNYVTSISVWMKYTTTAGNSPSQNISVWHTGSDATTTRSVSDNTVASSSLTTGYVEYEFTFANPVQVQADDVFYVNIPADANTSGSWSVDIDGGGSTKANENFITCTDCEGTYSDQTSRELRYSIDYVTALTGGEFYDYSSNDDHADITKVTSYDDDALVVFDFSNTNGVTNLGTGGSSYDGTNNGATTGVNGLNDQAYDFDGTNDQVEIGSSTSTLNFLHQSGGMTVSLWLQPDTTNNNEIIFDNTDVNAANTGVYTRFETTNLVRFGILGTTDTNIATGNIWTTNEWQHLAVTFDGSTGKIYRNGVEVATGSMTANTGDATYDFHIGEGANLNDEPFDGAIDEVQIFNTAKTANEILDIYNSGSGFLGTATIKSSHIDTGYSNELQLTNAGLNVTSSAWGISGTNDWSINSIITLNQTDPISFLSFDSGNEVLLRIDNEFIDLQKNAVTIFNHTLTTPIGIQNTNQVRYSNDFSVDNMVHNDGAKTSVSGGVFNLETDLDSSSDHAYWDFGTSVGASQGEIRFKFDMQSWNNGGGSPNDTNIVGISDNTGVDGNTRDLLGLKFFTDGAGTDIYQLCYINDSAGTSCTATGLLHDTTTASEMVGTHYVKIDWAGTSATMTFYTDANYSTVNSSFDVNPVSVSITADSLDGLRYFEYYNRDDATNANRQTISDIDDIEIYETWYVSNPNTVTITRDASGNYETLINGTESVTSTDATSLGTVTNNLYHIGFDTSLGNSGIWRLDELSIRSDEQTTQDSADFGERIQPFVYQASVSAPTTTYTHTGLVGNTDKCFKVTAWNSVGESTASGIECGTTNDPSPTQPTGLSATDISESRIDLAWDTAPVYDNITGYRIFYESPVGNGWIKLVNDTGTSAVTYSHTSLSTKTQYNYMVAGINATGVGTNSTNAFTTTWGVPDAPTGFSIINPAVDQLTLNYTASVPYGYPVTGYEVYRDNVQLVADIGNVTSYTDTGLGAVTSYDYAVRALSSFGSSGWANATGTTVTEPPTSLTVNDCYHTCTTQLNLEWVAPVPDTGVNGYKIETESPIGNGWSVLVANTTTTTLYYNHTGLANDGVFHNYRVYALTPQGESAVSNTYAYSTHKLPDSITDLVVTDDGLLQFVLNWSVPSNLYGTLSGYMINYTTPAGDPLTIETSDTGSTSTTYTKAGNDPTVEYSFRVSAVTNHGTNSTFGNIFNYTLTTPLEVGALTFSSVDNTDVVPYSYMVIPVSNTTDTVRVTFDSSFTTDCTIEQTVAGTTNSYTGLSETAGSGSSVYHDFSVQNTGNDVLEFDCWDQTDPTQNGQFLFTIDQTGLTSTAMPLVAQVQNFTGGLYGTEGEFGEFDLITLFVIILSMLGFNRKHPALGVGFMVVALGATRYYGLIGDVSLAVGGIAMIAALAIGVGLKKF